MNPYQRAWSTVLFFGFCLPVWADIYPNKSVRILVGFAPGGGTDIVSRLIGHKLTEFMGQGFIVDNRAGAAGTIAADLTAKSPADGYTLMMGHVNSHAIAPNLYKKLPYDPVRDFATVAYIGYVPNVLVIHPSLPTTTLSQLILLARSKPGLLTFASSGVGSTQHLAGELFQLTTKVKMVHVPYKGSGPAIIDLLAGHVDTNFDTMPPVLPYVLSGRFRALAVTTPKRANQLPLIPTMLESGLKGYEMTNWYGFMAPAKTPHDIVVRLNAEINKIMMQPDTKSKLEEIGTQLEPLSPEQFSLFLTAELTKYARVIKASGVKVD